MNISLKNNNTYITSDTHFGHRKEFIWQARGFNSIEEHDEILIQNWNKRVRPQDSVYHLGDVCLQPETMIDKILPRLNGKKYLILGNHDINKKLFPYFEKVLSIYHYRDFVFSHVPIHPAQMEFKWKNCLMCHGHIHGDSSFLGDKYFNVNIELNNNELWHVEEIRKKK